MWQLNFERFFECVHWINICNNGVTCRCRRQHPALRHSFAGYVVRFRFICHRDSESVSMWHVVIKGVDSPEGKKDWTRWQAGMQYGIRSEKAIEKEGALALFCGCFGTTAAMCWPCASKRITITQHPTLSSSVNVWYNYCIIFRTTRFQSGPPDSQGWWSGGPLPQNVNFEPCPVLWQCVGSLTSPGIDTR